MGSVIGGTLARAGNDVVLVDVAKEIVDAIEREGLIIEDKSGQRSIVRLKATNDPNLVGVADLLIVFVKCYHTEAAVRQAAPIIGPNTVVLSLQNGWGNAARISKLAGPERLLVGVSYHSAVLLAPGMFFMPARDPLPGRTRWSVAASHCITGFWICGHQHYSIGKRPLRSGPSWPERRYPANSASIRVTRTICFGRRWGLMQKLLVSRCGGQRTKSRSISMNDGRRSAIC